MRAKSIHKEILLVRTSLSAQQFCEPRDGLTYNNYLTEKKKLVVAWNSLLLHIFPEITEQHSETKKLCLCKMSEGLLFMELKMGEICLELKMESSIDPDSFMAIKILS